MSTLIERLRHPGLVHRLIDGRAFVDSSEVAALLVEAADALERAWVFPKESSGTVSFVPCVNNPRDRSAK